MNSIIEGIRAYLADCPLLKAVSYTHLTLPTIA